MVPCIPPPGDPWILQWYLIVPAVLKVTVKLAPALMFPESNVLPGPES